MRRGRDTDNQLSCGQWPNCTSDETRNPPMHHTISLLKIFWWFLPMPSNVSEPVVEQIKYILSPLAPTQGPLWASRQIVITSDRWAEPGISASLPAESVTGHSCLVHHCQRLLANEFRFNWQTQTARSLVVHWIEATFWIPTIHYSGFRVNVTPWNISIGKACKWPKTFLSPAEHRLNLQTWANLQRHANVTLVDKPLVLLCV